MVKGGAESAPSKCQEESREKRASGTGEERILQ